MAVSSSPSTKFSVPTSSPLSTSSVSLSTGSSPASSPVMPTTAINTSPLPGCDPGYWLCDDLVQCVLVPLVCDGTPHCTDGSDEMKCRECAANEKMCKEGNICILDLLWCDGLPHCPDQSDEADCFRGCDPGFWLCDDRVQCVPVPLVCDGTSHCADGSDEMKCRECAANEMMCKEGKICIPDSLWCDGHPHCSDQSDEADCLRGCDRGYWLCDDLVQCVLVPLVCDGTPHCADGSDEMKCRECAANEMMCMDGSTCIPNSLWCDGHPHCPDRSDEADCLRGCDPGFWLCDDLVQCVPVPLVCDGTPNCADGSDETKCRGSCAKQQWQCGTGECINAIQRCNHATDCSDGSDELECPQGCQEEYWQCQDLLCLKEDMVCDGTPDCLDGSDEQYCPTSCPEGRWLCSDHRACIPPFLWCDGVPNCFDGSDEEYCADCSPGMWKCKDLACIPATQRCDGALHCPDGSDEKGCHAPPRCAPYEYQCRSGSCVLQDWVCDGAKDCPDGSDEMDCGPLMPEPGKLCRKDRFACRTSETCIPRSFHCDGEVHCPNQSDELGCRPPKIVELPLVTMEVRVHEDLTLQCRADGVPAPTVVWRWNAVHVQDRCTQTSEDGVGVLTCSDIQPEDQGSFSCEAYNSRGSVLGVPATFVNVEGEVSGCLPPVFNAGGTKPSDCLPCFCFDATNVCYSTEKHVAKMDAPSPASFTLVTVQVDLFRGEWMVMDYNTRPENGPVVPIETVMESPYPKLEYYSLPNSHLGNQLLSFGGTLRYNLRLGAPLARAQQSPDVIIEGNDITLVHVSEVTILPQTENRLFVHLVPGRWFRFARPYTNHIEGFQPASREEIMTVLQDVQQLLIRAQWDLRQGSPNAMVYEVVMDTASNTGSSKGRAMLVEECRCPPGYNGTSCEGCSEGHRRVDKAGSRYGGCIQDSVCRPGEYGGKELNMPCLPCPCPLTGAANNFGGSCFLADDGEVTCFCQPGYTGRNCERCAPGYIGNPTIPRGSCWPVRG